LTVSSSTLSGNSAGGFTSFDVSDGGEGGAIYNAGMLTVNNSTLADNFAYLFTNGGYGGGIFNAHNTAATVTGSRPSHNNADRDGGGIYNDGTMTLSGSTLSGNVVVNEGRGGGIFNDKKGHLTIQSKSSITNDYPYDLYNLGSVKISRDSSVGVTVK